MKSIREFLSHNLSNLGLMLFESNFSNADWPKHAARYVLAVLNDLLLIKNDEGELQGLNKGKVYVDFSKFNGDSLGDVAQKDGDKYYITGDDFDKDKLQSIYDELEKTQDAKIELMKEFNSAFKHKDKLSKGSQNIWNRIVKTGAYTAANKGLSFEKDFASWFTDKDGKEIPQSMASETRQEVVNKIIEILDKENIISARNEDGKIMKEIDLVNVKHVGAANTHRALGDDMIPVKTGTELGMDLADITCEVSVPNVDKKIPLSLKCTSTLSFASFGLTTLFDQATDGNKSSENRINKLFNIFGTTYDYIKKNVFDIYEDKGKSKAEYDTTPIKDTKKLAEFIKGCVGAGYILVHKEDEKSNNIWCYDLMTEAQRDKLIGSITSANLCLPKKDNNGKVNAKRVKIEINTTMSDYIKMFLTIRSKRSDRVYPTHICLDYKITDSEGLIKKLNEK
jgi:hypothetical protein